MEKTSTIIEERMKKIDTLKEMGINPYPAGYECDTTVSEMISRFNDMDNEDLEKRSPPFPLRAELWLFAASERHHLSISRTVPAVSRPILERIR